MEKGKGKKDKGKREGEGKGKGSIWFLEWCARMLWSRCFCLVVLQETLTLQRNPSGCQERATSHREQCHMEEEGYMSTFPFWWQSSASPGKPNFKKGKEKLWNQIVFHTLKTKAGLISCVERTSIKWIKNTFPSLFPLVNSWQWSHTALSRASRRGSGEWGLQQQDRKRAGERYQLE